MKTISRREAVLMGAGVTLCLAVGDIDAALATPKEADAEIAKFTGGKATQEGKITIDLPEIAENGNTIPLAITVDAPMTPQSYVSDILVVADGNPNPGIATFQLTPLSGRAEAGTRIRLNADRERHRRGQDQRWCVLLRSQAGEGDDRRVWRLINESKGHTTWPTNRA